jgi:hypothetical protein
MSEPRFVVDTNLMISAMLFKNSVPQRVIGVVEATAVTEMLTKPQYAQATDKVYKGLWGRTAAMLREELGLGQKKISLRDNQPTLALTDVSSAGGRSGGEKVGR